RREAGGVQISVSTAALARPELLPETAREGGSEALVLSIDARRGDAGNSGFDVTTHGGKRGAGIDAAEWAAQAQAAGVGEILLNSIAADGTEEGCDLEMLRTLRKATTCPLIASPGAGRAARLADAAPAGAGAVRVRELLLNSSDADGTKEGFALEMLRALRKATTCPLIASGGAGRAEHFAEAAQAGADAVLAASVFHFGIVRIADVKAGLRQAGFQVV